MEMAKRPSKLEEDRKLDRLDGRRNREIGKVTTSKGTEQLPLDSPPKSSPSSPHLSTISQEQKLASTKVEMGEVQEENKKLKSLLTRVVEDYQSLRTHYFEILEKEKGKSVEVENPPTAPPTNVEEEHELVSLSLGSAKLSGSLNKKEEKLGIDNSRNEENNNIEKECLKLGLDCKFERPSSKSETNVLSLSSDNSFDDTKDEEPGEPWPPSKITKNVRTGDDDLSQQPQVKKARVSVRARCDTPTMPDGCQWRKYGQKIAKGNPCPRAYYRCTVATSCPVRKQVQRCADDTSILITTYEGTHNHPLPVSATAMASTTSAAASMLMSGSTSSRTISSPASISGTSASLHGLNFGISDHTLRSRPFFLPTASMSSTPSCPTITLDLTAPPASTTQPFAINRPTENPKYPSTSFSFSSPESSAISTSWSNHYLNYGSQLYNKTPISSLSHIGRPAQDSILNSYIQKTANLNIPTMNPTSAPSFLTDSIAKAITSDPSFQSALAAAITSYVGNNEPNQATHTRVDAQLGLTHGAKWSEQLGSSSSTYSSTPCASSFLSAKPNPQNASTQNGSNLIFSLGFPSSKSASTSPVEKKD